MARAQVPRGLMVFILSPSASQGMATCKYLDSGIATSPRVFRAISGPGHPASRGHQPGWCPLDECGLRLLLQQLLELRHGDLLAVDVPGAVLERVQQDGGIVSRLGYGRV